MDNASQARETTVELQCHSRAATTLKFATVHLFVGENMKKDHAGGIGTFFELHFNSDNRLGRAPMASDFASSSSVILYTIRVNHIFHDDIAVRFFRQSFSLRNIPAKSSDCFLQLCPISDYPPVFIRKYKKGASLWNGSNFCNDVYLG